MSNVTSFFRIFDIAFLAPGTLILLSLYFSWDLPMKFHDKKLSEPEGILLLIAGISTIYIAGLAIHSVQRVFYRWIKKRVKKRELSPAGGLPKPWYARLGDTKKEEMRLYFWYLRATCWNLAVALPVAFGFFFFSSAGVNPWWWIAVLFGVLIFIFEGREYWEALRRSAAADLGR